MSSVEHFAGELLLHVTNILARLIHTGVFLLNYESNIVKTTLISLVQLNGVIGFETPALLPVFSRIQFVINIPKKWHYA